MPNNGGYMKRRLVKWIKLILLGLMFTVVNNKVVYAANTMPTEDNEIITLSEDVTLTDKFVVPEGKSLTIDLAGYTLTGPSDNYTIENNGSLLITSSKEGAQIISAATEASCVQNTGNLNIENVTIDSKNHNGIKNDETGILVVNNSQIYSYKKYAGYKIAAIRNWGDATINDSIIKATKNSIGVYASSGYQAGTNTDSKIVLNNCNIESDYYAIYSEREDSASTTTNVNINDGSIIGAKYKSLYKADEGVAMTVSGKVEAPINFFDYLIPGSTLVLNEAMKTGKSRIIPEGITLDTSKKAYSLGQNDKLVVLGTLIGDSTSLRVYSVNQKTYYYKLSKALPKLEWKDGEPETLIINQNNSEASAITIPAGKNIIIDLNGKKLSTSINNSVDSTLTFKDDSAEKSGTFRGNIVNPENGTIIIDEGIFDAAKTITNKGILLIKGGNFGVLPITEENGITILEGGTYTIENMNITEDSGINIPAEMQFVMKEDGVYSLEYKDGNYSNVIEAIKQAEALNKEDYKNFSAVENAINMVVYGKNMSEQAIIDGYAKAIIDAINALEKIKPEVAKPIVPIPTPIEETKTDVENPDTGDNIFTLITIAAISLFGLLITRKYT